MTHRNLFTIVLAVVMMATLAFAGDPIATITTDGVEMWSYTAPTALSATKSVSDYLSIKSVDWNPHQGVVLTLSGVPDMSAGIEIITSAGKSWEPVELTKVGRTAQVGMPLSDGAIVFFFLRYAGTENYLVDHELYGNFYLPDGFKGEGHDVKGPIAGLRYTGGKPVPLTTAPASAPGNFE